MHTTTENEKLLGKPLLYKRIKITNSENKYTFITNEKPYQVGIDPYNYLVDRSPEDNVRGVDETK